MLRTHRLRTLDVAVFGPFKNAYKVDFNDWMMSNSGKTISFYYLDHLAGKAYFFSFAPENITKAFELPGIYPLNQLQ